MVNRVRIISAISGASFLMVLFGILVFLYAQSFTSSGIFPTDTNLWNKILTGYLIIFSLTLTLTFIVEKKVVLSLLKAKFWQAFAMRFVPIALLSSIILFLIKGLVTTGTSINIFLAISKIPLGVLLVHLFVVSQIEEIMFGGLLFTSIENRKGKKTANLITAGLFALWHFAKTGGNLIVMATYVPLRYLFNSARTNGFPYLGKKFPKYFGPTPLTQQANAGFHFSWNLFILGILPS